MRRGERRGEKKERKGRPGQDVAAPYRRPASSSRGTWPTGRSWCRRPRPGRAGRRLCRGPPGAVPGAARALRPRWLCAGSSGRTQPRRGAGGPRRRPSAAPPNPAPPWPRRTPPRLLRTQPGLLRCAPGPRRHRRADNPRGSGPRSAHRGGAGLGGGAGPSRLPHARPRPRPAPTNQARRCEREVTWHSARPSVRPRARGRRAGGERRGVARGGRRRDWLRVPASGRGAVGPWPRGLGRAGAGAALARHRLRPPCDCGTARSASHTPPSVLSCSREGRRRRCRPAMLVSERLKRFLRLVPGERRFGFYRFLPFFFVLGGAMEWFMINVRIGNETFCECGGPARSALAAPARAACGASGAACPAETLGRNKQKSWV